MPKKSNPQDRLIFALDVPGQKEAVRLVETLDGSVGCFKIGLELFIREGPAVIQAVREHSDADIFLDLKLHDIPETVRRALVSASAHGARYVTLHAEEGLSLLKAAGGEHKGLEILAVTVLTSRESRDPFGLDLPARTNTVILQSLFADLHKKVEGWNLEDNLALEGLVAYRTLQARDAGCAGVVCSGHEVRLARAIGGEKFKIVVPGVRPKWAKVGKDDQSRIVTPGDAIRAGADCLVVGRPIRDADDPKAAAQKILDEIAAAQK